MVKGNYVSLLIKEINTLIHVDHSQILLSHFMLKKKKQKFFNQKTLKWSMLLAVDINSYEEDHRK